MCIRDRYMGMSFHELMIEILEQIVKKTESLKLPEKLKTHFSSKEVPAISLPSYVRQISRYAECEESIHVAALIYIDRIVAHYPSFAINSRNVHKLALVGIMIAMKIFDDIFMRNSDYAIIGGVTVEELNCMEHEFLALIDFDLHIREGDYNNYCSKLHKFGARKIREKKISPCSDKELPLASTYESPKKMLT
eukprot:TRINITY_DN2180_c0_g1_i6.p1 TRINITY_DN2180_c0_g1~~TRINITY_DN2180_c0_g1_i6.p1  ORF type:complete len:193 (+),score=41.36 TRINITY_DN2180_c0_g1_i6:72-650(+)